MGIRSWFENNGQQQQSLTRASLALDNSSTCFMIADPERVIVYANRAVVNLLTAAQDDIRKELPQFSVSSLIGSNIDIFHKQPQHQKNIVSQLSQTHTASINVGVRCFKLVLNPLRDEKGVSLGTSVEWHDITEQKKHELLSLRVTSALEATSSNVMVADNDLNVIYMNQAVERMLREAESDLRKALPHFSVSSVIGSNIDIFHKEPSHQRRLLAALDKTYVGNIVVAGRSFRLIANPIFDTKRNRLGTVVEWIDRTKEVASEHELSRILGALETTTTNVMIADIDRNITYMNKSVENMLRIAEADLRKELPHFSVEKVVGSNIDIFHKNPAHQMHLLANLTKTYTANIVVGSRHFRLVANPIFANDGTRLGSVVEWLDRTQEVFVESEVNTAVQAAAEGDFTSLISTEGKNGFFLKLSEGLNSLLRVTESGLNDINRVLKSISEGDLTERVTADYQGSFELLKNGCNQTSQNLAQMLGKIRTAADTIKTASSEISQGNTDLSSRTEQQASSLEETASSMEELTGTVRQNADNARQANTLSAKASEVAINGGNLIDQVVVTMASINESSQKIADIIGVIDGIAFQTNILALNAAVEAARAGEQGRGFAVVASEVRTLAQRSANAAKDIKALISDSVGKINNGNELVGKSGDTMKEIVTSIKRVNDIMAEIAAASSEQATGLDEVGKAVSQMDEMTQQNAALVEEAAAAAESLLSQAAQLATNVSQFKLDDDYQHVQAALQHSAPKTQMISHAKSTLPKRNAIKPSQPKDDEWESF
ncbi:methyl-accepting chemotaxis protein [Shewanella sp. HL-SH2]|uniref:methyl-accepting chemotaxis protein n=1 Tax=Shewanella sp. HL-SH2 TaxID=3436238 RepID=UPI003EC11A8B